MNAMPEYFHFKDAAGRVHRRLSPVCPLGMVPNSGPLQDGERRSVHVPVMMMDSVQRDVAAVSPRMSDRAGASVLIADAGQTVSNALAACPESTAWMRDKVARAAADAEAAVSDGAFQNAVSGLTGMERRYRALSFTAVEAGDKAALTRAADAIEGYADGMLAKRGRPVAVVADAAAAQRELRQRISAGWRS